MVDYKNMELFTKQSVGKQFKIVSDDGEVNITNEELHQQKFELTESLCSDSELLFGSCEAGEVKFTVSNTYLPMKDKWITVSVELEGAEKPFQFGRYKVFSDVPTADRTRREVTAYDAMYDILNADVSAWYNTVLPQKESTVTMKQFRESFVRNFGLTETLPKIGEDSSGNPVYGLANDGMTVERTIEPEQISGKDVITAICEINGCFGHIGRDGKFHYIYLTQAIQGLYPADFLYPDHVPEQWGYLSQAETGHLYPQDPKGILIGKGQYKKASYEDYHVKGITRLQIRQEENDAGFTTGSGDNLYVIEDNFLVYGKIASQLEQIVGNIFKKIKDIVYRPFSADCVGNPCLEVGDAVRIPTKYEIIESYILRRTLKGIQALQDTYSSSGNETRSQNLNSVQKSIVQLKGKTNTLTRNVEETRSEIKDVETGLSSRITQNSESIIAEVTRATGAESSLYSGIQINAQGISTKVGYGEVISSINQSAEQISIKANKINLDGYVSAGGGNFEISESGELILSTPYSELKMEGAYLRLISKTGVSAELRIGVGGIWARPDGGNTKSMIIFPGGGQSDLRIGSAEYALKLYCSEARVNGLLIMTEQEFSLLSKKIEALETRVEQLESEKGGGTE